MASSLFCDKLRIFALTLVFTLLPAIGDAPIPGETIEALRNALKDHQETSSTARQRLALKKVIRDGEKSLETHPGSSNRFEILDLLFKARQSLVTADDSPRNREALLETARQLAQAPDSYASLRLDADLLTTQASLARQGANAETRLEALRPMVRRYQDTPAEARMLRIALVMALELGDSSLIRELRETISARFAGDLEMIAFQRDKLGGQVFGAPFCGTFKRSDDTIAHYPADGLGQSTGLYFWSSKDGGLEDLRRFAITWQEEKDKLPGRLNLVSFNLDGLPDAGEKILRDLDLPWPALHLPGGTQSPYYRAFARKTPSLITLSPTGHAALLMAGATRRSSGTTTEQRDYSRWFGSTMARSWSLPRYLNQLASLFAGDFFILDPSAPFDPSHPPEWKSSFPQQDPPAPQTERSESSVPAEILTKIQQCFAPPPVRYRLTVEEIRTQYLKAEELCAAALASHPEAPDLWIVHNRRLVAQMGLWKVTADPAYFQKAVRCAREALSRNPPPGTELLPQFCLARQALREPEADPVKIIEDFLASRPPETGRGPALAVAALLALDVGHRGLHEKYRTLILENHLEEPMMWTLGNFLLNRYHRYQLYRAPFVAGWSFGRRQDYFLAHGKADPAQRLLPQTTLPTIGGESFSLPQDTKGKWTALLIHGQPVEDKRAPLFRDLSYLVKYATERPLQDLRVVVAFTSTDFDATRAFLKENPLACPAVMLPGGLDHPLVQKLGILSEDEASNLALLDPEGRVAAMASGLTMGTKARGNFLSTVMQWQDEQRILDAINNQQIAKAQELAFKFAPPVEAETTDPKKGGQKQPVHSLPHLRARARVFFALGNFEAALADAEEVVKRQTATDAAMSFRTDELDEAEKLRDLVRKKIAAAKN